MNKMEHRAEIWACLLGLLITGSGIHGSVGSDQPSSPEIPSTLPPGRQFLPPIQEAHSPACCDDSPSANSPSPLPLPKGASPRMMFGFSSKTEASPPNSKDDGISPSSSIPLTPQASQTPMDHIRGIAPTSNAPTTMPLTPDLSSPIRSRAKSPGSPTIHTQDSQRPAASPTSTSPSDVFVKSYRVPVAAPSGEISNHLPPLNDTHVRGPSPVLSPNIHEITKPYKYSSAPTSSRPEPASADVVPVPAPAILHDQHEARDNNISPASSPTLSLPPKVYRKRYGVPIYAPSEETPDHLSPVNHRDITGFSPIFSPIHHEAGKTHKHSPAPYALRHGRPPAKLVPVPAPAIPHHQHEARKNVRSPLLSPSGLFPPFYIQGPAISPTPIHHRTAQSKYGRQHRAPPPFVQSTGPSVHVESPSSLTDTRDTPAPSPLTTAPSFPIKWHTHSPTPSLSITFSRKSRAPVPQPIRAFPPPPPNLDCLSLPCTEPYTNPPPGSPCVCVLPMKVRLRLGVALYTFFPLLSELAQEIGDGVFMKQSQVRVMGANAASEQPENTIVLINLVPLGQKFDNAMAFLTYQRFWHKQIDIKTSYFGDYDVLYVQYPGLPPSPPLPPIDMNMDDGPFGNENNSRTIRPLGVDVRKKKKEKNSATVIAIVVVSSVMALVLCSGAAWFMVLKLKHGDRTHLSIPAAQILMPPYSKASVIGTGPALLGSGPSSTSGSLSSSIATYTGTAKAFSVGEMERATNKFDNSRIIGEGGFGRVYEGTLENGTRVAVKVLKRDDHQGSREFLAEIEMLSRLHHRNLVKLIGICTEEHLRCLIYELIPNGSVESHLHGVDKETAPLDWGARVKIALGSARALSYLHEDSSPSVIHRDFKSSNILLEYDFTPKVSDFGLAKTALNEGNEHISTRVMGTFGYVAPEYALTGHLLVKSDVYSYGVVLLELITGRKPVDMSQPPGQENLVAWAHPLLTGKEDLERIIDPALGSNFPFDNVAKVAAIASMCVQPEVSHRPSMGEVVQALKLVCNESDEPGGSGSFNLYDLPPSDKGVKIYTGLGFEADRAPSSSGIFSPARFAREASGSFRRHSGSGPLKMSKSGQLWQRMRGWSGGSTREDSLVLTFNSNVEGSGRSSGRS